jgi:hypothetical protein
MERSRNSLRKRVVSDSLKPRWKALETRIKVNVSSSIQEEKKQVEELFERRA